MPIVKKFDDAEYIEIDQDILCKNLLRKDDLDDSRITIDYYKLSNKAYHKTKLSLCRRSLFYVFDSVK